ncbi:hypothetical protein [Streptomyces brevispora]|uniref:Uncharacterized protein n=1 Tax=Streptomyces brevispora TaxID=887462 RepID=A0A561UT95_9ACTN|nr:hypothetical protein [Streptomyces brevispora]TWG02564.1 hypothetical protein FHX80_11973 [Streptomyces brevispora]WSC16288.1 hypothetical protein OIE64_27975 [Streptomyces brevispora]
MAEQNADRAGSEEEREPLPAEGASVPDDGSTPPQEGPGLAPGGDGEPPVDEAAVWDAIVAGYGDEPPDPPGAKPFRSIEDLALLEDGPLTALDPDKGIGKRPPKPPEKPLGSSVVFAPGVGGPRDYEPAEPTAGDTDDGDDDGEGHFVPPEPPPLPEADVTAKFAWLAVVGGPVLLLLAVLLQWEMTWWLTTVCVGGFLGGFVTLVARMEHDDEDGDDPGRGAVV